MWWLCSCPATTAAALDEAGGDSDGEGGGAGAPAAHRTRVAALLSHLRGHSAGTSHALDVLFRQLSAGTIPLDASLVTRALLFAAASRSASGARPPSSSLRRGGGSSGGGGAAASGMPSAASLPGVSPLPLPLLESELTQVEAWVLGLAAASVGLALRARLFAASSLGAAGEAAAAAAPAALEAALGGNGGSEAGATARPAALPLVAALDIAGGLALQGVFSATSSSSSTVSGASSPEGLAAASGHLHRAAGVAASVVPAPPRGAAPDSDADEQTAAADAAAIETWVVAQAALRSGRAAGDAGAALPPLRGGSTTPGAGLPHTRSGRGGPAFFSSGTDGDATDGGGDNFRRRAGALLRSAQATLGLGGGGGGEGGPSTRTGLLLGSGGEGGSGIDYYDSSERSAPPSPAGATSSRSLVGAASLGRGLPHEALYAAPPAVVGAARVTGAIAAALDAEPDALGVEAVAAAAAAAAGGGTLGRRRGGGASSGTLAASSGPTSSVEGAGTGASVAVALLPAATADSAAASVALVGGGEGGGFVAPAVPPPAAVPPRPVPGALPPVPLPPPSPAAPAPMTLVAPAGIAARLAAAAPAPALPPMTQQQQTGAASPPLSLCLRTFHESLGFCNDLVELSAALHRVPLPERNARLRAALAAVSSRYLSPPAPSAPAAPLPWVTLPLGNLQNRVVALHAEEAFCFRTKERVPFMMLVEVLEFADGDGGALLPPPPRRRLHGGRGGRRPKQQQRRPALLGDGGHEEGGPGMGSPGYALAVGEGGFTASPGVAFGGAGKAAASASHRARLLPPPSPSSGSHALRVGGADSDSGSGEDIEDDDDEENGDWGGHPGWEGDEAVMARRRALKALAAAHEHAASAAAATAAAAAAPSRSGRAASSRGLSTGAAGVASLFRSKSSRGHKGRAGAFKAPRRDGSGFGAATRRSVSAFLAPLMRLPTVPVPAALMAVRLTSAGSQPAIPGAAAPLLPTVPGGRRRGTGRGRPGSSRPGAPRGGGGEGEPADEDEEDGEGDEEALAALGQAAWFSSAAATTTATTSATGAPKGWGGATALLPPPPPPPALAVSTTAVAGVGARATRAATSRAFFAGPATPSAVGVSGTGVASAAALPMHVSTVAVPQQPGVAAVAAGSTAGAPQVQAAGLATAEPPPSSDAAAEAAVVEPPAAARARSAIPFAQRWVDVCGRIAAASPWSSHPGWRLMPLIVKANDDLRQEAFAGTLMRETALIFKQEGVGVWMCPYDIAAVTPRAGFLAAVPDTISLDSLKRSDPGFVDLAHWFRRHFPPAASLPPTPPGSTSSPSSSLPPITTLEAARSNFMRSLAAYSIACYVFAVKDRHNGNILISQGGHLIHIDFGFLLTSSPGGNMGFEGAVFKLTSEMVDVLGGQRSPAFGKFRKLCIKAFLALRKHSRRLLDIVEAQLAVVPDLGAFQGGREEVLGGLASRLALGASDRRAAEIVHTLIDTSLDNWRTRWYDKFQRVAAGIAL